MSVLVCGKITGSQDDKQKEKAPKPAQPRLEEASLVRRAGAAEVVPEALGVLSPHRGPQT